LEAGSQEIKKPAGEAGFFIFAPGAERALRAGLRDNTDSTVGF